MAVATYPETPKDICDTLRMLQVADVDDSLPLHMLQHRQPSSETLWRCLEHTTDGSQSAFYAEILNLYALMDSSPEDGNLQYVYVNRLAAISRISSKAFIEIVDTGFDRICRTLRRFGTVAGFTLLGRACLQASSEVTSRGLQVVLDIISQSESYDATCDSVVFLNSMMKTPIATHLRASNAATLVIAAKHKFMSTDETFVNHCNLFLKTL